MKNKKAKMLKLMKETRFSGRWKHVLPIDAICWLTSYLVTADVI